MNKYTMFDLDKDNDLNDLFLTVGVSNYEEVEGFDCNNFNMIMKRNIAFEKYSNALWFIGMQTYINRNESSFLGFNLERRKFNDNLPERELMILLLALRNSKSPELTLKLSTPKTNIKTSNSNLIIALKSHLESIRLGHSNKFLKDVSDFDLSNLINEKKPLPRKRGAINKKFKVATLAIALVCILHWNEYILTKKRFDIKFSDEDCNLIYEYLLFWKLIEDKEADQTTTTLKKNYIRTMIRNIELDM